MQFIDLSAQYRALKQEIDANIRTVLERGQYISGPFVHELENKLSDHVGVRHCITCGNGTDAMLAVMMAIGVGQGDAVFCTDLTFAASAEPAKLLGASVVFCDIDPATYNISPDSLERQIMAVKAEGRLRPKAVIAVDILGNPADYDALTAICERFSLPLIEDAAQSFGGSYHGHQCAGFGMAAITSFYPAKPLGCYGDGGALFTNDDALAYTCRSICFHGKGRLGKYHNERVGMNSRLDEIQAAVLLPKLQALKDYELAQRQYVAQVYDEAFGKKFVTPFVRDDCVSAYAQYVLLAENRTERDLTVSKLNEKKIPTMIYYPLPQHRLPVFSSEPTYGEPFIAADDYCDRTFSLPMHPYLTRQDMDRVIDAVIGVL